MMISVGELRRVVCAAGLVEYRLGQLCSCLGPLWHMCLLRSFSAMQHNHSGCYLWCFGPDSSNTQNRPSLWQPFAELPKNGTWAAGIALLGQGRGHCCDQELGHHPTRCHISFRCPAQILRRHKQSWLHTPQKGRWREAELGVEVGLWLDARARLPSDYLGDRGGRRRYQTRHSGLGFGWKKKTEDKGLPQVMKGYTPPTVCVQS